MLTAVGQEQACHSPRAFKPQKACILTPSFPMASIQTLCSGAGRGSDGDPGREQDRIGDTETKRQGAVGEVGLIKVSLCIFAVTVCN